MSTCDHVQVLQHSQPQHMNVFAVLVGENGEANQEQQKRINAHSPSHIQLLHLLLITRLLQLITPMEEFGIRLLHMSYANIPTPLFIHLINRLLLRHTQLALQ
jgi:hypothetical protein